MNDAIKVDFKMSRKNLLPLSKVIERGMDPNASQTGSLILDIATSESYQLLSGLVNDLLQKGGLHEMNGRLKSFSI